MTSSTISSQNTYKFELSSLDDMMEQMEEQASREDNNNQSSASECLMRGFDDEYIPSYLR